MTGIDPTWTGEGPSAVEPDSVSPYWPVIQKHFGADPSVYEWSGVPLTLVDLSGLVGDENGPQIQAVTAPRPHAPEGYYATASPNSLLSSPSNETVALDVDALRYNLSGRNADVHAENLQALEMPDNEGAHWCSLGMTADAEYCSCNEGVEAKRIDDLFAKMVREMKAEA